MKKKSTPALDIARLRLASQHLTQPGDGDVAEVVRRLGAVQSQDYAGAKWGVGMRAKGLTDADVERAVADGSIIRTHVLRPTWHFLAASDARWILALTGERVERVLAGYCRNVGLDTATLRKADKIIPKALAGGNALTREELGVALERGGVKSSSHPQWLAFVMMHAELQSLICSGPRRGNQFTYGLFDERVPMSKPMLRDEALAELARRYFTTRGPATVHDFAWWSGLTIADSRRAVDLLGSELVSEEIGERRYWLSPEIPAPGSTRNVVHLLPNYDEYFIGFKDRSAILNVVEGFSLVPGNPLFTAHVVVLDGQLIGGWKRAIKGKAVTVDVQLVTRLTAPERRALLATAKQYADFLGLSVVVSGHE